MDDVNVAEPRQLFINDETSNAKVIEDMQYMDNYVSTSKYTTASFVPKTLFEFFRVVANCYFLVIAVLQVATPWSPTDKFTTAGPLVIVLMVTMVKQGLEDKKRHEADEVQNNRECKVLTSSGVVRMKTWKNVTVGDILRLENNEELPADVVILASSEEEGRCFVETSNLDGETNLKRRAAVALSAKAFGIRGINEPPLNTTKHDEDVVSIKGEMEIEKPNDRLYQFSGIMKLDHTHDIQSVGLSNILLRGCTVRSCSYLYGLVIYTGGETKLMQNARSTPSKQSNVYSIVNRCILLIFVTQAVLCLVSTISNASWTAKHVGRVPYLPYIQENDVLDIAVSFFTFLILYNNLVPISLYVSLDMIKVIQAKIIATDSEMIHDNFPTIVRTSNLNEELGQVQHIFSDKTGTLTQNIMEFRKCAIGAKVYGYGTTEVGRAAQLAKSRRTESGILEVLSEEIKGDPIASQVHYNPKINFGDPRLLQDLKNGDNSQNIHEFLTLLSVCHTVITERDSITGLPTFRASSPDEDALVKAAKCLGYHFVNPAPDLQVDVTQKDGNTFKMNFSMLNVNEFNSTRKRMSVVVQNEKGEYVLYCKGADTTILPLSIKDETTSILQQNLENFAREGLRTLMLAKRTLSEEEYKSWDEQYQTANNSLEDRDAKLAEVAALIEDKLIIVGATAIEDKLQQGVPDTIRCLREAHIKVWILTGDKEETAINIGYACQLLDQDMTLLIVNSDSRKALISKLDNILKLEQLQDCFESKFFNRNLALICDGQALVHIFPPKDEVVSKDLQDEYNDLANKLLKITSCCSAVIACRVSPAQKAEVVKLVRYGSSRQAITLAIGDGANDVNMIQSSHVGIGICGHEGVQAVNSSDYAIAQFRFLKRLLLVHGRQNYKRISKVILYSFYKNIALVMALFLFNFLNGQSGTSFFESFVMAGWNFFLAMPIIAIGIFDEDVPASIAMQNPRIYETGQQNCDLNLRSFSIWIVNAIFHGAVCFAIPLQFIQRFWSCDGMVDGLYFQGTIVYTGLLMTMNAKVVLLTMTWTKSNISVFAFSIFLYFFFLLTYPSMTFVAWDMFGVGMKLLRSPIFWLTYVVVPLWAILVDISGTYIINTLSPSPTTVLRENYYLTSKRMLRINPKFEEDHVLEYTGALESVGAMRLNSYTGFGFSVAEKQIQKSGHANGLLEQELITNKVNLRRKKLMDRLKPRIKKKPPSRPSSPTKAKSNAQ